MSEPLSLYLHIPFCVRKCAYCDFLSFPADERIRETYLEALTKEIRVFAPSVSDRRVVSVFLGGGTPSLLSEAQIAGLLSAVFSCYNVEKDAEITLEANPGTLTAAKLSCWNQAGVNRLSLGLQSANDRELALLGRIHTWRDFLESFSLARDAGFDNINVDLISALPGQTLDSWEETLQTVLALSPEHISAYSLMIEEGTPFFERYHLEDERRRRGEVTSVLPDEDVERQMYDLTDRMLGKQGYRRYEISNYAKPGRESIHNIGYWIRRDYAGFGLGAASLCNGSRSVNPSELNIYLEKGRDGEQTQRLSREDCMEELMFLGLRLTDGVEKERFFRETGVPVEEPYGDVIRQLEAQGLLEEDERFLRLTKRGLDLSNYCMAQFLL